MLPAGVAHDRGAVRLRHSAALYRLMRKSAAPSSVIASEYLHRKKQLSSDDRRAIAEHAFSLLRMEALAEHCLAEALHATGAPSAATGAPAGSCRDMLMAAVQSCLVKRAVVPPGESSCCSGVDGEAPTPEGAVEDMAGYLAQLCGMGAVGAADLLHAACAAFADLDADAAALLTEGPKLTDAAPARDILAARCSVPLLFLEAWERDPTLRLAPSAQALLACSLLDPAPACARVVRGQSRDAVLAELHSSGIPCSPTRLSPSGIVLEEHSDIRGTPAWVQGRLELQDEGSQCVAFALNPAADWRILDACAGAGGKSLHLADLQDDRGAIDAADADARKLRELRQRAARMGLRSIRIVAAVTAGRGGWGREGGGGGRVGRKGFAGAHGSRAMYDAVLVDAPCSGSGTVRRFPARKWSITPGMLRRLAARQLALLLAHADAVRPGGVLLYATCSFLHAENADVIAAFLAARGNFLGDPLLPQLSARGAVLPALNPAAFMATLTPSREGTDGFFIARLIRTV